MELLIWATAVVAWIELYVGRRCLSSTYLLLKYLSKYSVLAACLGSMLAKRILSRAQTLSYTIHYTYYIDVPYLVCLALAFKTKVRITTTSPILRPLTTLNAEHATQTEKKLATFSHIAMAFHKSE
jgi:hypothetical protein